MMEFPRMEFEVNGDNTEIIFKQGDKVIAKFKGLIKSENEEPKPERNKFSVGDKVVPHSKSYGHSFKEWFSTREHKPFYLVQHVHYDGDITLNIGGVFKPYDVTLYVEPTPEPEPAFKVGDRVRVVNYDNGPRAKPSKKLDCKLGTLKCFTTKYADIIFDENIGGWGKEDKTWCIPLEYIELAIAPPINHAPENKTFSECNTIFTFHENKTTCIIEAAGREFKGVAKCEPGDKWDETIGKGWAGVRALQNLVNATKEQLREM